MRNYVQGGRGSTGTATPFAESGLPSRPTIHPKFLRLCCAPSNLSSRCGVLFSHLAVAIFSFVDIMHERQPAFSTSTGCEATSLPQATGRKACSVEGEGESGGEGEKQDYLPTLAHA